MVVKKKVRDLSEVPEGLRGEYVKQGDEYVLQLDGDDGADRRVNEFRNNNVQLKRELDELKAKYQNVDLDKYQASMTALEKARNDEERQLLAAGKFEEVLERRTQLMRENSQRELEKLRSDLKKSSEEVQGYRGELKGLRLESRIAREAAARGIKFVPSGIMDVHARANALFQYDDEGQLVAMRGDEIMVTDDGKDYGVGNFLDDMVQHAPHLFEGARGADTDANPRRRGSGFGGVTVDPGNIQSMGRNIDNIATAKTDVRMG